MTSKLTLGLVLLFSLSGLACAQNDRETPFIKDVRVGLDGVAKVGVWTPVRLTVGGGKDGFAGKILLRAPDSDGIPAYFASSDDSPMTVAPGAETTLWRYAKLGRTNARLSVVLRQTDGQFVAQKTISDIKILKSTRLWVAVLGGDLRVERAARFLSRRSNDTLTKTQFTTSTQLPDQWIGWEGVDVLMVTTSEEGILEQIDDVQFAALKRWLQLGGQLVISCGSRAEDVLGANSRWQEFGPGKFEETVRTWRSVGLESYIRASKRVPETTSPSPLAVFQDIRGRVECYEALGGINDRPVLMRYPFGFGQITFLATDLEKPPLVEWVEHGQLLARLIRVDAEEGDSSAGADRLGQVTHVGFDDLTGQLRGALDQFEGITLVRFSWIAALLVAYILLIGPLDFLGLRKLGKPHWTWITFPLIVAATCFVAYALSNHLKGSSSKVNQVDVVDVDMEQSLVRGTMWANLYSPDAAVPDILVRTKMPLATEPTQAGMVVSWQGLPGAGLGGMDTTAGVGELSDGYTVYSGHLVKDSLQPAIRELPIHTSSSKAIVARWWQDLPPTEASSDLRIGDGGLLNGFITNPLNVELSNCSVYFDNWAYRLDRRLAPGDRVDMDYESPLDLRWQLTRRRLVESRDIATPWDRSDFSDVGRILEMMMFHNAAGGRAYTRLGDEYQPFVDLSHHLKLGRAVLIGRVKKRGVQLLRDGQAVDDELDVNWTYYRVVFPLERLKG